MASGASPRTLPQQGTRTSFGGYSGANAAHLLERSRAGLRGSTPDSEALASSDDEQDQLHRLQKVTSNPVSKPGRRASWLTEQSNSTRNVSMGAGPFSPISPGAANPSSENIPWGSHATQNPPPATGRGHSSSASFPWSNTIWNTDTPKGPPQRLAEVIPSPTTVGPPGSAGVYGDEGLVSPRDMSNDQSIPFAIPLQPTPKTYRSQSYSVGQLDPDAPKPPATNFTAHNPYVRGRIGSSYAGLSHRPSRPSMLGDGAHDPQQLGQLREVDDDNESLDLSDPGLHQASDPARTIEHLARENAMLRQQAAESRERAAIGQLPLSSPQHMSLRNRRSSKGAMSEGSDQAVFDAEDGEAHKMYKKDGSTGRRFSEFGANATPNYPFTNLPEHRTMETIKKGQWQSSLGFGGIGEPPQSRRHSFAEVPTRQNSTTTGSEVHSPRDIGDRGSPANMKPMSPGVYNDGLARPPQGEGEYRNFHYTRRSAEQEIEREHLRTRLFAVNYFSRMDPSLRGGGDEFRSPSSTTLHSAYAQGPFGRGQQYGINHTRPKQLLYLVTFKCQRADVFYIQENTGLRVHKGDLVIVEADRGTDLGTVASDCVAWAEAKEAKDRFIEEHHRWLMMFSQHGQNGTVASHNPNGPPQSATLGPGTGQSGISDVPSGELKPKMIKRVAQPHEIQALREKEGAEAKAKRACQQKVIEHRLRMEILDAEFQM